MNDQVTAASEDASGISEPSLLDTIIPVVTLVGLIGLTIWLSGTDATGGPLQVALLPFALFNLLSRLISLIYGFTGFHIERVSPPDQASPPVADPSPQPVAGGP